MAPALMTVLLLSALTATVSATNTNRRLHQLNTANASVPSIDKSGNSFSSQTCPIFDLQCLNGGYQSNLVHNCDGTEPQVCGPWSLDPSMGCTCGTGNIGYDCALDTADRCLQPDYQAAHMTGWDSSFLNPNTGDKSIQCIIPDDSSSSFLSLMNHRIQVTLNAQTTTMSFTFFSQLSLTTGCTDVLPVITCSSNNCEFGVLNDGSGSLQLQCTHNTCTSCNRTECSTYQFITNAITTGQKAATILLTSQNSADATGAGSFSADTGLLQLQLPIQCQTGQCLYIPPTAEQIAAEQAAAAAAAAQAASGNGTAASTDSGSAPVAGDTTGQATLSTIQPIVLPTVTPANYVAPIDPTPLHTAVACVTLLTAILVIGQLSAVIAYRIPKNALKRLAQRDLDEADGDIEKLPGKQMELTPMLQRKFDFDGVQQQQNNFMASTTVAGDGSGNGSMTSSIRVTPEISQLSSEEYDAYNKSLRQKAHGRTSSASTTSVVGATDSAIINVSDIHLNGGGAADGGAGIVFKNLSYTIQQNGQPRHVLNNISAHIAPSSFVAVMGPSGSGKTSLMRILAGPQWTLKNAKMNGKLYITRGGTKKLLQDSSDDTESVGTTTSQQPMSHASHVSYVQQHENLLYTQTVREALMFSAKLRCPKHYTASMIAQQIDYVLEQLRISHIADSLIGSPEGGGLSGGERRRVSIGVELVTQPGLLLLDEALSGLDSNNAEVCMRVIRDVSRSGVGCVLSIHQPSLRLFDMFDTVLLLTKTGQIAYYGPPQSALAHFSTLRYTMPQFITAPEFLLKLASVHDVKLVDEMISAFDTCELGQNNINTVDKQIVQLQQATDSDNTDMSVMPAVSTQLYDKTYHTALPRMNSALMTQLYWLSKRIRRHDAREPTLLLTQLSMTIAIAVLFGGIYWHLDNMIPGIQNRMGFLFFILIYFCLTSMSSLVVFIQHRPMIKQELNASYYSATAYYICYYANELLLRMTLPLLFGLISYFMVGLQSLAPQFLLFLLCVVMVTITSTALCLCVSAVSSTAQQANFIAVILLLYCILFGGLFVNNSGASTTLSQLNFSSFIHYIYEAIVVNELNGLPLVFNPIGVPPTKISGEVILNNYGFDSSSFSRDLWAELGFFAAFSAISCVTVLYRHRTRTAI